MSKELKYIDLSDEEVVRELRNRIGKTRELLREIRDLLKSMR